jgi:hypothetical protein
VFTARYALSPYIKRIRFVFKGLKHKRFTYFLTATTEPVVRNFSTILQIVLFNGTVVAAFCFMAHFFHECCKLTLFDRKHLEDHLNDSETTDKTSERQRDDVIMSRLALHNSYAWPSD